MSGARTTTSDSKRPTGPERAACVRSTLCVLAPVFFGAAASADVWIRRPACRLRFNHEWQRAPIQCFSRYRGTLPSVMPSVAASVVIKWGRLRHAFAPV